MAEKSEERVLFINPSQMGAGITPDRNVSLHLGKPSPSLGFDPAISFAVELSPADARWLADLLIRKADAAEGITSRH